MKRILPSVVMSIMLLSAVTSYAEEQQAEGNLSGEEWVSNGAYLGAPWWKKNPKKYDAIPDPLLYHFEFSYSYMETGGNVDINNQSGKAELILRKNTLTSDTFFRKTSGETVLNLLPTDIFNTLVENQALFHEFKLAVLDNVELTAGFIWVDNNTIKYVDDRKAYYVGMSSTLIDMPTFQFNFDAAYGYRETAYMNELIPASYNCDPVDDYDSDILFLRMNFNWDITDMISLSENVKGRLNLEDTDYYNWDSSTRLNFKVAKNFSFFADYTISYDFNTFVEAVQECLDLNRAQGNTTGIIDDTDTRFSVGVKLEF